MFMKKDPTEEEIVEGLSRAGISTKTGNNREDKFGAFRNYAQERAQTKSGMKPVNPYANQQQPNDPKQNPYANGNDNNVNGYEGGNGGPMSNSYLTRGSPYANMNTNSATSSTSGMSNTSGTSSNAYNTKGASATNSASPYGQRLQARTPLHPDPYARPSSSRAASSRLAVPTPSAGQVSSGNPYGQSRSRQPNADRLSQPVQQPYSQNASVSRISTRQSTVVGDGESTLDLNDVSSHQMFRNTKPIKKQTFDDNLDLNEEYHHEGDGGNDDEFDLNLDIPDEQEEEINSEDEEVNAIKQDIRFVKQESVQSTRNTLRMAQEADASGTNTLGMLGSQSERLYNAEQNLLLGATQTQIADEKVKELKRLNRSIFVPAYGNPFNKKSRLRRQEEDMKARKMQEKYLRESNRQGIYESEQRLKQGIMNNATLSETHHKYMDEKNLAAAKRYQFENDSEDDEMEKELASNLDQIGSYAKKLHGIANTMGKEVDSQNLRLTKIEEDADKLDINVHMNSTRLNNIR